MKKTKLPSGKKKRKSKKPNPFQGNPEEVRPTFGGVNPAQTAQNKLVFLAALEKALGIVSQACRVTGIGRRTYYDWCVKDPDFKAAVDDLVEVEIDFAESKLHEMMNGVQHPADKDGKRPPGYLVRPSVKAITFYLNTKGKRRGYVIRNEHTGKDGTPLGKDPLDDMTKEEIQKEIARLEDVKENYNEPSGD